MSEEALLKSHFKTGEEMRRRNMAGGEIQIPDDFWALSRRPTDGTAYDAVLDPGYKSVPKR